MAWYTVPLDTTPEQEIDITLDMGDEALDLTLHLTYNTEGDFWRMDIRRQEDDEILIANLPMLTGEYPAADLLGQFQYLGIGSAVILKLSDDVISDYPDLESFGTEFALFWYDGQDDESGE